MLLFPLSLSHTTPCTHHFRRESFSFSLLYYILFYLYLFMLRNPSQFVLKTLKIVSVMLIYRFGIFLGSVEAPPEDYTVLLASVGGALVAVLLTLCILCHRKRRRRRRGLHRPLPPPGVVVPGGSVAGSSRGPRPPQHVCDELGERFASVDSV